MDVIGKPSVYIPPEAKFNKSNQPMEEIKTKYEEDRVVFDLAKVKEIVKGIYGNSEDRSSKL